MAAPLFEIEDLHVRTVNGAGVEVLRGVSLTVEVGEIHAVIGPKGSGASTLASALLGSPHGEVTSGSIRFNGDDITDWPPDVRSKAGLFLAFQDPQEIAGVSVLNFLRQALNVRKGVETSVLELRLSLMGWMDKLGVDASFMERHVNGHPSEGFSSGEKKRSEILQMAVLEPEMAILDETDSALDIDALVAVAHGVRAVRAERPELGLLAITHYQQLLDHLKPDQVHMLYDGRIVASGGPDLALDLERNGYESLHR